MSSLSPVIQGLLVALVPEYEISNDAIGYVSEFAEKVLVQLANQAAWLLRGTNKTTISSYEIQSVIRNNFPSDWASTIVDEGSAQLNAIQNEEKDAAFKQEISDFELIEDESNVKPKEVKSKENIFLSADFIKSFLSPTIPVQLGMDGCIFLSVCIESVLSTLIQQSCVTLQTTQGEGQTEGELVITKQSLLDTIDRNEDLRQLSQSVELHSHDVVAGVSEPLEEDKSTLETSAHKVSVELGAEEQEAGIEPVEDIREVPEIEEESAEQSTKIEEQQAELQEEEPVAVKTIESEVVPETEEAHIKPTEETAELSEPEEPAELLQLEEPAELLEPEELEEPAKLVQEQELEEPAQLVQEQELEEPALQEPEEPIESNKPKEPEETEQETELSHFEEPMKQNPKDVIRIRKPVFELYGRCCPYFEITSFAIHMLSSIMEYFLRSLVSESSLIAKRARTRAQKVHARAALRRLTESQNLILAAISRAEGSNLFTDILPQLSECVYYSFEVVPHVLEKEARFETYVSEILLYVATHLLLVASAHARMSSSWLITSDDVSSATLQFVSEGSPVYKFVQKMKDDSSITHAGEGDILQPPQAPRIRAAEMIYLTSIIKETPLQLDNQLLIVFLFLVSLSLHTLCCVR